MSVIDTITCACRGCSASHRHLES